MTASLFLLDIHYKRFCFVRLYLVFLTHSPLYPPIYIYIYIYRYNIPELAKKHKVYAIDLLGFGWSEKALIEYDAMVWRDQVVDFLKEIVKEPAVLVGNR